MKRLASRSWIVVLLAIAAAPACAGAVALEGRPCPCAEGWTCCSPQNVCVAPGGECAPSPDGGETDAARPQPLFLATGQSARCVTTDREHVYWQNANGIVSGTPKTVSALATSRFPARVPFNALCGIAVDGDTLFTTSYSLGKIVAMSLSSNGEWSIGATGAFVGELTTPSSLAVDADAIYVTEFEAGRVTRVPRSGGPSRVLADGLLRPDGIVAFGDDVYFRENGADGKSGAIKGVAKLGGDVVTLAGGQHSPFGLAFSNGMLFWAAGRDPCSIWSVSIHGEPPRAVTTDARAFAFATDIAADDLNVYYVGGWHGIKRVPVGGGESTDLPGDPVLTTFVLDGQWLYGTADPTGATIVAVAK